MLQKQIWALDLTASQRDFMDDVALVTGLQRGDPRAVEYVVQQYAPGLYRYAQYQLQDPMGAEDLVSEVMIRMIQKVDKYVPDGTPFQAWLFRIAHNLIIDQYRARKRRPQVSFEGMMAADASIEPAGDDNTISALADRDALQAGLSTLTDEQRQVILLHVVEGWEMPQVARLLDRSLPSVKSLYYRGVQSLRRALTHDGLKGTGHV